MKRIGLLLFAILSVTVFFCACGQKSIQPRYTLLEISQLLLDTQPESDMQTVRLGEDDFTDYVVNYYEISDEMLEDGVISYAQGANAMEFAVLIVKDEEDVDIVEEALLQYIDVRIGSFWGYMPEEVYILEQAVVEVNGRYVALIICEESKEAVEVFENSFETVSSRNGFPGLTPLFSRTNAQTAEEPGEVDTDLIVEAWKTGDTTGLSGKNLEILEACAAVIDEHITDTMTEYEKELAIHDWMIQWGDYDTETKNRSKDAQPHPDNHNPYGFVIGQRAICTGYTTTFQLFMDLLDIECLTIHGAARTTDNEHAWNMVRIDGDWYFVDVTWNDPSNLTTYDEEIQHAYFNVTTEFMLDTRHLWDTETTPEATATQYCWIVLNPPELEDEEE